MDSHDGRVTSALVPMLAEQVEELSAAKSRPGWWRYEFKWDGYQAILCIADGEASKHDPLATGYLLSGAGEEGRQMASDDKIANKAQDMKGKGKEAAGKATDNEQWKAEGKADQAAGNLKQAGEKAKDAAKDVVDK